MKKIKVLELTDARGGECDFYSEQFEALLNGIHMSQTDYYLTDGNYIVEIENGIDLENNNVKSAISMGAVAKDMFYVDDKTYSENIYDFDSKGFYDGVEYGEEEGVIFKLESDAKNYEEFINVKIKIVEKLKLELVNKTMTISELIISCNIEIVGTRYEEYNNDIKDNIELLSDNTGYVFGETLDCVKIFRVYFEIIKLDKSDSDIQNSIVKITGVEVE